MKNKQFTVISVNWGSLRNECKGIAFLELEGFDHL